jgi:NAD(P)H-hydrate epimerase
MTSLSRAQARRIDQLASEDLGIPSIVLMENAGLNATLAIRDYLKTTLKRELVGTRFTIFCGGGNNGGDGYVVARHLHNRGAIVQIIAHKPLEKLTGDAAINAHICKQMNLDIQPTPGSTTPGFPAPGAPDGGGFSTRVPAPNPHAPTPDLLIDALLGTGFQGNLRPDTFDLIQHINAARNAPNPPKVIALDLPSGLDCDTGQPPKNPPGNPAQDAVRADLTITFVAPKLGFSNPAAKPYLGEVIVADIGTSPELLDRATVT